METRTKTCPVCGKRFSYEVGKGNDRKYCAAGCRKAYQKTNAKIREQGLPPCKVDGCSVKANRVGHGVCEMHYCRMRRIGTYAAPPRKKWGKDIAGYIVLHGLHGHPIASPRGSMREHRKILWDMLDGGKPTQCRWCGVPLVWDDVVADHLNEDKQDNSEGNLVPSCNNCNRARGAVLPFIARLNEEALEAFIHRVKEYNKKKAREKKERTQGN